MVLNILFNGEPRETQAETTIAQLLESLSLPSRRVAVEVNRQLIPRQQHAAHILNEGDEVEVVTFVGGG
ncbi:Sulfur carrier protein ThiS [Lignipirellula cremea]|uniref:Sulfur carrier protein ThiS n=2 Tax=Lignipirellula cremea TaxID=2528010 RepID=A0A518DYG1_9BACT|nr:sulfur carrier protein ThiS [Lignipirellula cremea]QDU96880.1 Sulfur carrier protein ThiS [Lignipirellula cremea]